MQAGLATITMLLQNKKPTAAFLLLNLSFKAVRSIKGFVLIKEKLFNRI